MNTIEQRDTLHKILDSTESMDASYRRYSGRGMHGSQCLGITLGRGDASDLCGMLDAINLSYSRDSMGLDSIVYFTYINDLSVYQDVLELDDRDEKEE